MRKILKNIYLPNRFFLGGAIVVLFFIAGFVFEPLILVAKAVLLLFVAITIADGIILFRPKHPLHCMRQVPQYTGLADPLSITLTVKNTSALPLRMKIYEELPEQFQERKFNIQISLAPGSSETLAYSLRPLERGQYYFGNTLLYMRSALGLLERRIEVIQPATVSVLPSILQMKRAELKAFPKMTQVHGMRRIRRIGHSYEFEQIKTYVTGDDYRSINWKATGRRASLMVNQYEDERAQQVYFVLDKSRSMLMPFHGLSLLDYSINSILAMANVLIRKQDRAGLITFSRSMDTIVKAEKGHGQLRKLMLQLYNEKENEFESNYELLYTTVRRAIPGRSLLMLFTNFESHYAMERILPILRKLNKMHLLLVVFFGNEEIADYAAGNPEILRDIYYNMAASKFVEEKEQISYQLRLYGIQVLQTTPQKLTEDVIDKYLEFKSRGMI